LGGKNTNTVSVQMPHKVATQMVSIFAERTMALILVAEKFKFSPAKIYAAFVKYFIKL